MILNNVAATKGDNDDKELPTDSVRMKKMIKMTMWTKKMMIKTKIKVITSTTELKITSDNKGRYDSDKNNEMIAGLIF